ncbi:MAG: hypothetical protein Q9191_004691 [Dirinaria sp. TL-2023a]
MADEFYAGRRVSYGGAACTVRYIGQVQGTQGDWLGVEWDDATRGKHCGFHAGVKYFHCRNPSPTAGSFVRPNRPVDKTLGFIDALRQKYAAQEANAKSQEVEINISGKKVEEVGFEKIARQLANLQELRVVLLDGLGIAGVTAQPLATHHDSSLQGFRWLGEQGLKIQELDISRNLVEEWADVLGICAQLKFLRILKLNGNRFRRQSIFESVPSLRPLENIRELSLDETYLSWHETLNLASNCITTLSSLSNISKLSNLKTLVLRSNPLASLASQSPFPALSHLDMSSTRISTFTELINLPISTPVLNSLLTSNTPLHALATSNLHTIARIPNLTSLNYSNISTQDRNNAELYYLSSIASALSSAPADEEKALLKQHPRYQELCTTYGEPTIVRKFSETTSTKGGAQGSLAARLTRLTFYIAPDHEHGHERSAGNITKSIPRTIGIYALKGIVARLFGLRAMSLRLIWETDEWDPVAGESDGWSVSDEDLDLHTDAPNGNNPASEAEKVQAGGASKQWVRREVELADGTKDVGFWIENPKARIRIELR